MKKLLLFFVVIQLFVLFPTQAKKELLQPGEVRPISGSLDEIPVFNSNFPEIVRSSGILLSTFPKEGRNYPDAHLDYEFNGRFDIFTHHISRHSARTLFQAILIGNASDKKVSIKNIQGLTYTSLPDSPFLDELEIYSGPGDRLTSEFLKGENGKCFLNELTLEPHEIKLLAVFSIRTKDYRPSHNGRSLLARFKSDGPVHLANLAMFFTDDQIEKEAHLEQKKWVEMLNKEGLVIPREKPSTKPFVPKDEFHYGRVGGVAIGSIWKAKLTDTDDNKLEIPKSGKAISFPMSTVIYGEIGTGQIQSAKMESYYPDTAYEAHGNYGIHYDFELPLFNSTDEDKQVSLIFQTPIKERELSKDGLRFYKNPKFEPIWFRGTVKFSYEDEKGEKIENFYHLIQRSGEISKKLETFKLKPKEVKNVEFELIYPPDATPPQVLTVRTEEVFWD
ncbi:MAG: DUF3370 domain-containing protein [Candidatus Caenarcaniphilales bacterium]|nr:DUF3370 domain-containing protein [Candidatus Caenarcaniphilales bacterium]